MPLPGAGCPSLSPVSQCPAFWNSLIKRILLPCWREWWEMGEIGHVNKMLQLEKTHTYFLKKWIYKRLISLRYLLSFYWMKKVIIKIQTNFDRSQKKCYFDLLYYVCYALVPPALSQIYPVQSSCGVHQIKMLEYFITCIFAYQR